MATVEVVIPQIPQSLVPDLNVQTDLSISKDPHAPSSPKWTAHSPLYQQRPFLVPLKYPDVFGFRDKQESLHWHSDHIDLSEDASDWKKLEDHERYALLQTLGFFYRTERIVGDNAQRFVSTFEMPEAKSMFLAFANMEATHETVYGKIIEAIEPSPVKLSQLMNSIVESRPVGMMYSYAAKVQKLADTDPRRIIYMIVVEGLLFSGNFVLIFWLRTLNLMKQTAKLNEYIARDEGLHRDACIHLLTKYVKPYASIDNELIYDIVNEGVQVAKAFMDHSITRPMRNGLTVGKTHDFIEFIANHMLKSLGLDARYSVHTNPIPFMEAISLQGKTNIHEERKTEYQSSTETAGTLKIIRNRRR